MASKSFVAAEHVEQTLRLSRADAERVIARYRVGISGVLAAMSFGMIVSGQMPASAWGVPVFHLATVVAAVAILIGTRRLGAPLWLSFAAITFDLVAPILFYNLSEPPPQDPPQSAEFIARWFIYIPQAMLAFFLFVNQLRASRATAIYGAVLATALFWAAARKNDGPHPAQFVVGGFLLLMGVVGVAASVRQRKSLELFARLQLLRQYLPDRAVERVLKERIEDAVSLGGQSVEVTILSSDLRGFTQMSESLTPEEVVSQLNEFHAVMLEQVIANGGSLDKFIGDGMLAVFGLAAPGAQDAGAASAVACARGMLVALETLNRRRASRQLTPLAIGVGIHTGRVVAGNIGAPGQRLEYTVLGDAVNTAARLEGLTKTLRTPVVISEETARRLGDRAGLAALPPTEIRGKSQALSLFALDVAV